MKPINSAMRCLLALALFTTGVSLQAATAAPAGNVTRYTVLSQGKDAGRQLVERLPGNRLKVDFSYRDNGRGPDILEDMRLDANGVLESFIATGKSTYGAPVDERFSRRDGRDSWKSKADQAERVAVANAIYVPIENSFETIAVIARALLRAPGQKLPALPNGQLAIEKVTDARVTARSVTVNVTLYAITGFGVEPSYLWLRADGPARRQLFAVVFPSFSMIEAGWEENSAPLLSKQLDADARRLKALAGRLSHHSAVPVVVRDVRWFDSEAAVMKGPADVHVFRGRIAAILPVNSPLRDAATLIDGTGKTLLPGLADLHGHTSPWDSVLQVAGGITTLRDMGGDNAALNSLQTRVDAGDSIGPHIVLTGFIEGDSPFFANGGFTIKSVEEGKQAIDWYAQHGYQQIKLYNSIRPEWVQPIADYAHARGIRVSGHIPAFMRAEEAVRAGFDEIQHINQVVLNFLTKQGDDTRTLLRFYLVGDNANQIDLESAAVKDFIALLVERRTSIDPTLTTFEAMFLQRQGTPNPSFRTVSPNMPPAISRSWLTNSMDVTDQNAEPFRKSFEKLLAFVKRMYDAGVPLVAGSDDIAGFSLHRELELYVMAGMTPAQALQIATRNGAQYAYRLGRSGSITVGKDADLILVEGDPVANISDVRKVSMTMKSGVMFFPAELYEALGVKPFTGKPVVVAQPAPKHS